jgi:hypothetical protein
MQSRSSPPTSPQQAHISHSSSSNSSNSSNSNQKNNARLICLTRSMTFVVVLMNITFLLYIRQLPSTSYPDDALPAALVTTNGGSSSGHRHLQTRSDDEYTAVLKTRPHIRLHSLSHTSSSAFLSAPLQRSTPLILLTAAAVAAAPAGSDASRRTTVVHSTKKDNNLQKQQSIPIPKQQQQQQQQQQQHLRSTNQHP